MTRGQLRHLSALARRARVVPVDPATRQEQRVKSVFGNLGIERPDLTIEQVRKVLSSEDRASR